MDGGTGPAVPGRISLLQGAVSDGIVIATHGITGWRHVMFGPVAEKVVRLAYRPVPTIPAPRE